MTARRPENKGLPARWTFQHGAYYYRVPVGMESMWDNKKFFRLGKTPPDAYKQWAERLDIHENTRTVGDLLDRYAHEVIPTKSPATRESNNLAIRRLRAVFGALPITGIRPRAVYQYVDKRSAKFQNENGKVRGGRIAAHREIEVLSHAFTKAVEWGYLDRHPFKGEVRLQGEKPRTRYVEDWEVLEALSLCSSRKKGSIAMIQSYIRLKLLTGMRRGDLLRLRIADLRDDGIHVMPHKTQQSSAKRLIYEWTDELTAAVEAAKSLRPVISPYVFCNRRGECYINAEGDTHGWDSMWQRFMDRVMTETKVVARFTEHDLRAKCASDAESLDHARALLAHADERTTERVYRRKPERVKPLR